MGVDLVGPESVTEPRHWMRHDQAFAMMLRPGSIEWGSKRCALEKFDYATGDLALCDRHIGEWVGLMNVTHLQLGVNQLLEEMNRPGVTVLPYPLQRGLMRSLAIPAQQAGRSELLALWAGQSARIARHRDVATLLHSLVNEVSGALA
jgi:hypothetical protein